jgi:ankyrin repeat protein
MKKGASPRITISTDRTPLHICIRHGFEKCARILVQYGANMNVIGKNNISATDLVKSMRPSWLSWWNDYLLINSMQSLSYEETDIAADLGYEYSDEKKDEEYEDEDDEEEEEEEGEDEEQEVESMQSSSYKEAVEE